MADLDSQSSSEPGLPIGQERSALTFRSIAIGLLGVAFICGMTPFNDYVLQNTFLVGNFLPVGLVMYMTVLVLGCNSILRWKFPGKALARGELAMVMALMLVGSALPSSGLMRYLPANMAGMHVSANQRGAYFEVLEKADLPMWLFPSTGLETLRERVSADVYTDYFDRTQTDGTGLMAAIATVPWKAWLTPLLTWGPLLLAFGGAMLSVILITRKQWAENERLPFPLAQVYLSLVEEPERGRKVGGMFTKPGFWVVAGIVFFIHAMNGLSQYYPEFPTIPLKFDGTRILADDPWRFLGDGVKQPRIFFILIGLCWFVETRLALSIWVTYAAFQVVKMFYGTVGAEITWNMQMDQTLGAGVAIAMGLIWVGRAHWMLILKQMVRGARSGEDPGKYMSNRAAGWMGLVSLMAMWAWFVAIGVEWLPAAVCVLLLLLVTTLAARVVAETGLVFVHIQVQLQQPLWWAWANSAAWKASMKSFFMTSWFSEMFAHDLRENMQVFGTQAVHVADEAIVGTSRRTAKAVLGWLVGAVILGFFIAGVSTLMVEYTHASSASRSPASPINGYGVRTAPEQIIFSPSVQFEQQNPPRSNDSRLGNFGFGAAVAGILTVLRLSFAWWPLHPIGYLLLYSYPVQQAAASIFLGWLAKSLLLKFGGISLYRKSQPLFLGLIFGECAAAAVWLVMSLILYMLDQPFWTMQLMPG